MKHNLFSLLPCLVGCGLLLSACGKHDDPVVDNYRLLLDEGSQWNVLYTSASTPEIESVTYKTSIQSIQGDSTIKGVTYKKVMLTYSESKTNWQLYALLREDITEQKIYLYKDGNEVLLYDFGMKIGDKATLYLNNYYYSYPIDYYLQLQAINTLTDTKQNIYHEFVYGVYVKEEDGYNMLYTHTTYERFGSKYGLIPQNMTLIDGGGSYQLLCAYDSTNTLLWSRKDNNKPYDGYCFYSE